MLFAHIGIVDEEFDYQPDCFVGVRGDTITYIGAEEPSEDFGERYDGRGKVLLPGLVNAHSHAPMTLMRGYAENLALDDWLNTMIFPFEAKMTDDEVYPATQLAIA
jgi:5-methylthioadenosine/S-adenosylhomocysteine deaminase